MSTVSRPHTQQRKVSRRRRVIRRFAALIAVAFVSATVFEGVVLWTHKAFAAPWTSAAAFAEEWADMPLKCQRRLAGSLPSRVDMPTRSRSRTYVEMGRTARERGIEVFGARDGRSAATQGLRLDDMFKIGVDGKISPNLMVLEVPVRAIVIPFPVGAVSQILHQGTVKHLRRFGFVDETNVYLQNPEMFHFSVFHASNHLEEHAVSEVGFREEVSAIRSVTRKFCPIRAVLERVTVTSGGVVVAGWNVERTSLGEPSDLRARLREVLPRAPTKQLVSDAFILHTTLARLVRPPDGTVAETLADAMSRDLTDEFCGLELTLDRAWFVSEHHKLALALKGAVDKLDMPFDCHSSG